MDSNTLNQNLIENLVLISSSIGNNKMYVQGGGGNVSVKVNNNIMAIKASGIQLRNVTQNSGYSLVNYQLINNVLNDSKITEDEFNFKVKNFLINNERPSMELGFHSLLKTYVIHSHSVYANILTCSEEGQELTKQLFKDSLWINYETPGFDLTMKIKNTILNKNIPEIIFLQNHGLIVTSNDCNMVLKIHNDVNFCIKKYFKINEDDFMNKDTLKYTEEYMNNHILFPDQVVYINKNNENIKSSSAYVETICAYNFIISNIIKCNLTPSYIQNSKAEILLNMESEKYRQGMLKNDIYKS